MNKEEKRYLYKTLGTEKVNYNQPKAENNFIIYNFFHILKKK